MTRSLALIAVGVAVAAAVAIVAVGLTTGGGEAGAGSSGEPSAGALPAGHPSIGGDPTEEPHVALKDLEARRAEDPGDVRVLLDLGEAYFFAQRLDDAEQTYDEALGIEPDNVTGQTGRAMVWHAQGRSKQAEAALRAVLKRHPDDQETHFALAILCFSDGRVDEARSHWQRAADLDPASATGRRAQSFVDLLDDGASTSPHSSD